MRKWLVFVFFFMIWLQTAANVGATGQVSLEPTMVCLPGEVEVLNTGERTTLTVSSIPKTYQYFIQEPGELIARVGIGAGHPEAQCLIGSGNDAGRFPCDQGQQFESIDMTTIGVTRNVPDPGEDQWESGFSYSFGAATPDPYIFIVSHVPVSNPPSPESVEFKIALCLKPQPATPTHTPTNTDVPPSATPTNTDVPPSLTPTNTEVPPTLDPSQTPTMTNTPGLTPSATASLPPTLVPSATIFVPPPTSIPAFQCIAPIDAKYLGRTVNIYKLHLGTAYLINGYRLEKPELTVSGTAAELANATYGVLIDQFLSKTSEITEADFHLVFTSGGDNSSMVCQVLPGDPLEEVVCIVQAPFADGKVLLLSLRDDHGNFNLRLGSTTRGELATFTIFATSANRNRQVWALTDPDSDWRHEFTLGISLNGNDPCAPTAPRPTPVPTCEVVCPTGFEVQEVISGVTSHQLGTAANPSQLIFSSAPLEAPGLEVSELFFDEVSGHYVYWDLNAQARLPVDTEYRNCSNEFYWWQFRVLNGQLQLYLFPGQYRWTLEQRWSTEAGTLNVEMAKQAWSNMTRGQYGWVTIGDASPNAEAVLRNTFGG